MKITALLSVVSLTVVASSASAVTVYANNSFPGDNFTNPGTSNANQLIGSSGWLYNNVRNNGVAGINTNLARSGNGSAWLKSSQGGALSSKADIEYVSNNGASITSMGSLGSLNALSYDWYRKSGGAAAAHLHPVLRMYIDADGNMGTSNDRGYLVFERAYNPTTNPVPTNAWQTDDVFNWNGAGSSANVWWVQFGVGIDNTYNRTIQNWIAGANTAGFAQLSGNSAVYGLSSGVGSGWDTMESAVDNLTIGFAGSAATTYNFEVVPEPTSILALSIGGLALLRRRKKSA